MIFDQLAPNQSITHLIACYWVVENSDKTISEQKIIPDGFPEIIFHYKDPYEININGSWELQSKNLVAGQITNHFYLRNTGVSGMIGIKFRPAALTQLFHFNMSQLVNKVVDISSSIQNEFNPLIELANSPLSYHDKISLIDAWLVDFITTDTDSTHHIEVVIEKIFEENGMIQVNALTQLLNISERQMERIFKQFVGLSPKFFCRIIRFNYIFKLITKEKCSWTDLAFSSGFFDQSHFIKNFKEFTGEDPSAYGFDDQNMANFFLRR